MTPGYTTEIRNIGGRRVEVLVSKTKLNQWGEPMLAKKVRWNPPGYREIDKYGQRTGGSVLPTPEDVFLGYSPRDVRRRHALFDQSVRTVYGQPYGKSLEESGYDAEGRFTGITPEMRGRDKERKEEVRRANAEWLERRRQSHRKVRE